MMTLTITDYSPTAKKNYLVGCVILTNIIIFGAIFYLFSSALQSETFIFTKTYYKKILLFTILQGIISALLCTSLALLALPSLFSKTWKKRERLYWSILNLSYFTPSLIGAFAIVSIFGQNGLIATICAKCNLSFVTFVYGMSGVVLAHMFFYLPITIKNLRRYMDFFPEENARLGIALGLSKWQFWFAIVLPFLKTEIIRVFSLVCLYCFRSFTTVLILGGGILGANTLEIALFQALQFESNSGTFAQIAITQFLINSCFFAMAVTAQKISPKNDMPTTNLVLTGFANNFISILPILAFIGIALGVVFLEGLFPISNVIVLLTDAEVITCCIKNISIGLVVCIVTIVLCFMLIHGQHRQQKNKFVFINFEIFGYYTLIFSPLVIASSFIFILQKFTFHPAMVLICIMIMQILSALPSVYRLLSASYSKQLTRYNALCAVNGISGFRKFILIDWPFLKPVIGFSIASVLTFSLGDARSFLFFSLGENVTLITLLFERIRSYHFQEAAALATFILMLCYIIFYITAKIFGDYKIK